MFADNATALGQQGRLDVWDVSVACVLEGWSETSSIPQLAQGSAAPADRDRSYEKGDADVEHAVVDIVESSPW